MKLVPLKIAALVLGFINGIVRPVLAAGLIAGSGYLLFRAQRARA